MLVNLPIAWDLSSCPGNFQDPRFRLALYRVIKTSIISNNYTQSPLLPYAVTFFNNGLTDPSVEIIVLCRDGLAISHRLLHPVAPPLHPRERTFTDHPDFINPLAGLFKIEKPEDENNMDSDTESLSLNRSLNISTSSQETYLNTVSIPRVEPLITQPPQPPSIQRDNLYPSLPNIITEKDTPFTKENTHSSPSNLNQDTTPPIPRDPHLSLSITITEKDIPFKKKNNHPSIPLNQDTTPPIPREDPHLSLSNTITQKDIPFTEENNRPSLSLKQDTTPPIPLEDPQLPKEDSDSDLAFVDGEPDDGSSDI